MDVSENRGTPKWMVYNGKPYYNEWFGGTPIFGNTQIVEFESQSPAISFLTAIGELFGVIGMIMGGLLVP